jgi:hypothetical protein
VLKLRIPIDLALAAKLQPGTTVKQMTAIVNAMGGRIWVVNLGPSGQGNPYVAEFDAELITARMVEATFCDEEEVMLPPFVTDLPDGYQV